MAQLNHSRQRSEILDYLKGTKEHPTASTIYAEVRKIDPKISLGTVYRNLTLLEANGMIRKLSVNSQPDRFDYDVNPHYHLCCTRCQKVVDLDIEPLIDIDSIAEAVSGATIRSHDCTFYGICNQCCGAAPLETGK
ncbi:MAG: transcriptional repressor [Clostridiales bacterium]|nr:transcriptional repressor [Clostridiales bacterium]